MHSLPIRQQDNPKAPAFHLINPRPSADAAVSLDVLPLRGCDDARKTTNRVWSDAKNT